MVKILTIDNGQNRGSGVMVINFLTIDHEVNSRVTWSWSVTIKSDRSLFKRSDEIEEWKLGFIHKFAGHFSNERFYIGSCN